MTVRSHRAFTVYQDSATLWDSKIKDPAFDPEIPCSNEVSQTLNRYGLKCVPLSRYRAPLIPGGLIQYLWSVGSSKLLLANAVYNGTTAPKADPDEASVPAKLYQSLFQKWEKESAQEIQKAQEDLAYYTKSGWTGVIRTHKNMLKIYLEHGIELKQLRQRFESEMTKPK